jgi:hypothetical protein
LFRSIAGVFAAILIFAAFGFYYLLSKLNDFEDPLLNAAYEGNLQTVEELVTSGTQRCCGVPSEARCKVGLHSTLAAD